MLILTSPSKSQDYDSPCTAHHTTEPLFAVEVERIATKLARLSQPELQQTLEVSDSLAELNFNRYHSWGNQKQKPAICAYTGTIYQQLHTDDYSLDQQLYAQHSLRIISGLYGLLRPYDLIEAYRLEMKIKLQIENAADLYEFWQPKLIQQIVSDIENFKHTAILNLASQEYSKAIDFAECPVPVITVDFKQVKNGEAKTYGLLAKKARGQMIEFCIQNEITDREQVKQFAVDNYEFTSETEDTLTFTQPEQ